MGDPQDLRRGHTLICRACGYCGALNGREHHGRHAAHAIAAGGRVTPSALDAAHDWQAQEDVTA